VGGETRDVGSEKALHDIQDPLVGDEANPERVVAHQRMMKVLGPDGRVAALQPLNMLARFGHEIRIDDVSEDGETVAFVLAEGGIGHDLVHLDFLLLIKHSNQRNECREGGLEDPCGFFPTRASRACR